MPTKPITSWSCQKCGATTTDPTHMMITYFHMNCPATNKGN